MAQFLPTFDSKEEITGVEEAKSDADTAGATDTGSHAEKPVHKIQY